MKSSNSIDIAILISSLGGGGAERAAVNLIRGFVERGLKVELLLFYKEGVFLNYIPKGVNVVNLNLSFYSYHSRLQRIIYPFLQKQLKSTYLDFLLKLNILKIKVKSYLYRKTPIDSLGILSLQLANYLKNNYPKTVLSIMTKPNLVALKACQLIHTQCYLAICEQNTPSILFQIESYGNLIKQWIKELYPKADVIVAVSQGVAEDLVNNFDLPLNKIRVIHNPVVTPEIQEMAVKDVNHPWFESNQLPIILGVGRLHPQKDFPTLIRAFSLVRQVRPARLVILGEGKERPKLEQLINHLGIQHDVSMPGFVDNPFAFMAKASVFVLSSAWEGFGNVIAEALACGCPVVSTDCPSGPREILDNGRYGRLVPVGDPEALAKAILETLDNPDKPANKEERVQRAMEFSVDKIVDQYLEILGLR